jgi:hypothetical protein
MDEYVFDTKSDLEVKGLKPIEHFRANEGLQAIKDALIVLIRRDHNDKINILEYIEAIVVNPEIVPPANCVLGSIYNHKVIRVKDKSWNYCHVFMNRTISHLFDLENVLSEFLPKTQLEIIEFVENEEFSAENMLELIYVITIHFNVLESQLSRYFVLTYDDINIIDIGHMLEDNETIHNRMVQFSTIMKTYLESAGYVNYSRAIEGIKNGRMLSSEAPAFLKILEKIFNKTKETKTILLRMYDRGDWASWHYEDIRIIGYIGEIISNVESIGDKIGDSEYVIEKYIKPKNVQLSLIKLLIMYAHFDRVRAEHCPFVWYL